MQADRLCQPLPQRVRRLGLVNCGRPLAVEFSQIPITSWSRAAALPDYDSATGRNLVHTFENRIRIGNVAVAKIGGERTGVDLPRDPRALNERLELGPEHHPLGRLGIVEGLD